MSKLLTIIYFAFLITLVPGTVAYLLSSVSAKLPSGIYLLLLLNGVASFIMLIIVSHKLVIDFTKEGDEL